MGKTEIARRLAKLVNAPFVKVEATKFTEVGYVGRDVESIIRDLTENAVRMVKQEHEDKVRSRAEVLAEDRLATLLSSPPISRASTPLTSCFADVKRNLNRPRKKEPPFPAESRFAEQLSRGELEDRGWKSR